MTPVSPFYRVLPYLLGGFLVGAVLWTIETGGEVWSSWDPPVEDVAIVDSRPAPGMPVDPGDVAKDVFAHSPAQPAPTSLPDETDPSDGGVSRDAFSSGSAPLTVATPKPTPKPKPAPKSTTKPTPKPAPKTAPKTAPKPTASTKKPAVDRARPALGNERSTSAPRPELKPGWLIVQSEKEPPNGRVALAVVRLHRKRATGYDETAGTFHLGPQQGVPLIEGLDFIVPDRSGSRMWVWESLPPGIWRLVALDESEAVPTKSLPIRVRSDHKERVSVEWSVAAGVSAALQMPDGSKVTGAKVRVYGPLPDGFNIEHADPQDLMGVSGWFRVTDEKGRFDVRGLIPGERFAAHAWTPDGVRATQELHSTELPARRVTWTATPPIVMRVTLIDGLTGEPVPRSKLQVVDHSLNALSGVSRDLSARKPLRTSNPTDKNGVVIVRVERGAWLLANEPAFEPVAVKITDAVASARRLEITLHEPRPGTLRVRTSSGAPVRNAVFEAAWESEHRGRRRTGALREVISNGDGLVTLADMGDLSDIEGGALDLRVRHVRDGIASIHRDLDVLTAPRSEHPPALILQRSGSLVVQFATTGWPVPPPRETGGRWNVMELGELDGTALTLHLTLRHLGTTGPFSSGSRVDGEQRRVLISAEDASPPTVRFDDLEAGIYALSMSSRARGFSFTTPALRVTPEHTTHHWVDPYGEELFSVVALEIDSMPFEGLEELPEARLMREAGAESDEVGTQIRSPVAGEPEVQKRPIQLSGRVTFRFVPAGRYFIEVYLPDDSAPGGSRRHVSNSFDLLPGEDLLVHGVTDGR